MEQTEQKSLTVVEAAKNAIKAAKEVLKAAEDLKPFITASYDREALMEEAHDLSRIIYGVVGGSLFLPIENFETDEPIEALLSKAQELIDSSNK